MKTYVIRWRGRSEGPLSLEEIERRLDAGQLGMLTEIQVETRWMTLRDFYHSQVATQTTAQHESQVVNQSTAGAGQSLSQGASSEAKLQEGSSPKTRRLVLTATAVVVVCLLGGLALASRYLPKAGKRKTDATSAGATLVTNETKPAVAPSPVRNATNTVIASTATNVTVVVTSNSPASPPLVAVSNSPTAAVLSSNTSKAVEPPSLPPLPENEPRTFRLKNGLTYTGSIIDVKKEGLIIKIPGDATQYTSRLAWELFDEEALAREPKVIAFRKAQEAARQAAEQARIAAEQAAERAEAERAEAEKRLEEYHAQQDRIIESSIGLYGTKIVTEGHLKAWSTRVSIGELFSVVAPSARWSAGKLLDDDSERYTHYLVEARWTNDKSEPVAMQYLVTADGSDFHLHGCFVSGSKVPDLPFLLAVKQIWNGKQ